jgi:torulene dioxygenase
MSSFRVMRSPRSKGNSYQNVEVTVQRNLPGRLSRRTPAEEPGKTQSVNNLWLKTDNNHLQKIDPATLEPIQIVRQDAFDPSLKGPFTGAHSRTDSKTGDLYNYNLETGRQATYRIFCVPASTGKTTVLATISDPSIQPAYVHSMFLTQHYVVPCIIDAYFAAGGLKMLWTRNMLDAMYFDPHKKNEWLVVDRVHGKGLVGTFESELYFASNCINAWEEKSGKDSNAINIILKVPAYENIEILKRFYYENMKASTSGSLAYVGENRLRARPQLTRWKLGGVTNTRNIASTPPKAAERVFAVSQADTMELPTFNPLFATKSSRYIYGCSDRGEPTFLDGLIKLDAQTRIGKHWNVHAHSPGEPIFVPDLLGEDEDDGVLLSVVLDRTKGTSYLLVLDAKTFSEIGRAMMDFPFALGFHGTHVPRG